MDGEYNARVRNEIYKMRRIDPNGTPVRLPPCYNRAKGFDPLYYFWPYRSPPIYTIHGLAYRRKSTGLLTEGTSK